MMGSYSNLQAKYRKLEKWFFIILLVFVVTVVFILIFPPGLNLSCIEAVVTATNESVSNYQSFVATDDGKLMHLHKCYSIAENKESDCITPLTCTKFGLV